MSRKPIAVLGGCVFILVYIIAVITLPDHVGPIHWALQALYWAIAGSVWVFPIRWIMLWSVHQR